MAHRQQQSQIHVLHEEMRRYRDTLAELAERHSSTRAAHDTAVAQRAQIRDAFDQLGLTCLMLAHI